MPAERALQLIKLAHTAIWAVMAAVIFVLPIAAMRGCFRLIVGELVLLWRWLVR